MPRLKQFGILAILAIQIQLFGQINDGLLIDSTLLLKTGIYTSVDEFLNNSPRYPCSFKVSYEKPDYHISRKEQDHYFLDFYTQFGEHKVLALEEIWGFCDGYGIYLNYDGRPYQMKFLGQISILHFVKVYRRSQTARFISVLLGGDPFFGVVESDLLFYLLDEDRFIPFKKNELKKILLQDSDIYKIYKAERNKYRWILKYKYIALYNTNHSLNVTENGIIIEE